MFVEIVVVCCSVLAVLSLDGARNLALDYERKKKMHCPFPLRVLIVKRLFRMARMGMFLVSIGALVVNAVRCCLP